MNQLAMVSILVFLLPLFDFQTGIVESMKLPTYSRSIDIIDVHQGVLCYCTEDNEIILYDYMQGKYRKSKVLSRKPRIVACLDWNKVVYVGENNRLNVYNFTSDNSTIIHNNIGSVTHVCASAQCIYFYDCFSDRLLSYDTVIGTLSTEILKLENSIISMSFVDNSLFLTGSKIATYDITKGWTILCDKFDDQRNRAYTKLSDVTISKLLHARWCSYAPNKQLLVLTSANDFYTIDVNSSKRRMSFPQIAGTSTPIKYGNRVYYVSKGMSLCVIDIDSMTVSEEARNVENTNINDKIEVCTDRDGLKFVLVRDTGKEYVINLIKVPIR